MTDKEREIYEILAVFIRMARRRLPPTQLELQEFAKKIAELWKTS